MTGGVSIMIHTRHPWLIKNVLWLIPEMPPVPVPGRVIKPSLAPGIIASIKLALTVNCLIADTRNVIYSWVCGIIPHPSDSHISPAAFFCQMWSALKSPSATNIHLYSHLSNYPVKYIFFLKKTLWYVPSRILSPIFWNIDARPWTCQTINCKLTRLNFMNHLRTASIASPLQFLHPLP